MVFFRFFFALFEAFLPKTSQPNRKKSIPTLKTSPAPPKKRRKKNGPVKPPLRVFLSRVPLGPVKTCKNHLFAWLKNKNRSKLQNVGSPGLAGRNLPHSDECIAQYTSDDRQFLRRIQKKESVKHQRKRLILMGLRGKMPCCDLFESCSETTS